MPKNGSDMNFEGCIVQNYIKIFDCFLTVGNLESYRQKQFCFS